MMVQPLFLEGTAGPLFAVRFGAEGTPAALFLPPLFEERNRSRRMTTLLGQALAARGMALLVLDPYGTGDSAGDLAEASWRQWLADAETAVVWLRQSGHSVCATVGLRFGALLALAAAAAAGLPRAVLWQPLSQGGEAVTQLLRAAAVGRGGSMRDLRARLAAGETLEVAGYPLTPALAVELEGVQPAGIAYGGRVSLFTALPSERFWAREEAAVAPRLIDATCAALEPAWN